MRRDDLNATAAEQLVQADHQDVVTNRPSKTPLTHDLFLGEILLGAEMISEEELEQAMHVHYHEGVQVGEALIRAGAMTPARLDYGLEIQRRLRNLTGLAAA